jgi:hypothetical protein
VADNNVICHPWEPSESSGKPMLVFPPIHWVKKKGKKKKESKKGKTSQNGNSSVPVAKTHFVASVTDL